MLQKRIDLGAIPLGLYEAKTDIKKGRLVKLNDAERNVEYATNDDEAVGFATLRIDHNWGSDAKNDVVAKGEKPVVYTLVKNNIWGTTEVENIDSLKPGDTLTCGSDGKLNVGDGNFVVVDVNHLGGVPAVDVKYVGPTLSKAQNEEA